MYLIQLWALQTKEFWQILFLTVTFNKVNIWYICNCIYQTVSAFPIGEKFDSDQTSMRTESFTFLFTCLLIERFFCFFFHMFQTIFLIQDPHASCDNCHRTWSYCDMTSGPALWCHEAQWVSIMNCRNVRGSHFIAKKASNILTT